MEPPLSVVASAQAIPLAMRRSLLRLLLMAHGILARVYAYARALALFRERDREILGELCSPNISLQGLSPETCYGLRA